MHINDPKNIIGILGILGAFVMIFSVLLDWVTVNRPSSERPSTSPVGTSMLAASMPRTSRRSTAYL